MHIALLEKKDISLCFKNGKKYKDNVQAPILFVHFVQKTTVPTVFLLK